jgi:hypothetical protein
MRRVYDMNKRVINLGAFWCIDKGLFICWLGNS